MTPPVTLKEHRGFFIVLVFAAVLFLSDIWIYQEFVRAESYYAVGARLMVENDAWLMPHSPDEAPLTKPPLTYWLIGISYKLFGVSYGSSRLPSVFAAIAVLAIVYAVGVWLEGIRSGLISAAMLASSYIFLSFARMAMSDMLLTLWVTATLGCFLVALTERSERNDWARRLALLGWVAIALGLLTKGPVAFVLVAAPITVDLLLRAFRGIKRPPLDGSKELAQIRQVFTRLRVLPGLILCTLIAGPYFLLVYTKFGGQPLRFFFFGENLHRFTGQIYGESARPFWLSLASFFVAFAPWCLLIFLALWFDGRLRQADEPQRRVRRILYLSLGCTIALFSISSFKLDYYLLPAMPAAALLIGGLVGNPDKLPVPMRRIVDAFILVSSVVTFSVALFSLRAAGGHDVLGVLRYLPAVVALAGTVAIFVYLARRKTWQATMILTATIWATILSLQLALMPTFIQTFPAKRLAAAVPVDSVLYFSREASGWANDFVFNFTSPHRVERLNRDENNEKLLTVLKSDPKAVAVVWGREYSQLFEKNSDLKILAEGPSFGRGGLTWKKISNPRPEGLLLIGRAR